MVGRLDAQRSVKGVLQIDEMCWGGEGITRANTRVWTTRKNSKNNKEGAGTKAVTLTPVYFPNYVWNLKNLNAQQKRRTQILQKKQEWQIYIRKDAQAH